ncbi:MAG: hypothetical protein VB102_05865 [Paludibacter sp.]|nr:hypothetical protein [Paludibacter sp.]
MIPAKYTLRITLCLFVILLTGKSQAQSYTAGEPITLQISSYSLIATNNAPVNLTLTSPMAGAPITSVSNSDMYVKVSSIVPGGTHRELTARIASGTVPVGTKLTLVAAPCTTANSGGVLGTAFTTPILLNAIDKELVDMIGTCYTGTGYNDGYRLTYTWMRDTAVNYGLISSTASPVTITVVLTITAHDSN